jgi:hypothetical protein
MHIAAAWFLLIFAALSTALILLVLHLTKLGQLIHQQIPDRPQRRLFLASISFFITFLACFIREGGASDGGLRDFEARSC